jgi:helicase
MEEDFRVLKTAMLLDNWISEIGDDTICTRFGVGPGDIYNVVEGMNWLLYSASRISYMMAPDLKNPISEVELRMRHGIKRELIPLVKLKNIGRVRARRLFNNGITGPLKIKETGYDKLSAILGQKIAGQVLNQVEKEGIDERDDSGPDNRKKGELEKGKEKNQPDAGAKKTKLIKEKNSESAKKQDNEKNQIISDAEKSKGQKSLFEF